MIILNVTYKCKPGMREEFLKAIRAEGLDAACRAEALALHGKEPHFARIGTLKPQYVIDTLIERFER